MTRSVKKGPFIASHLLGKIEHANKQGEKTPVETWSRSSIIVPIILGQTILVYNGREHISVYITDQMVGHKLGEFSATRNFRGHTKSTKKAGRLIFIFSIWDKKLIRLVFDWVLRKNLVRVGMLEVEIMLFSLEKMNIFVVTCFNFVVIV
jgi:small subunit ribosomal protein S19